MTEALIQHYTKQKQKTKISFCRDVPVSDKRTQYQHPLGTGGAVKNAEKLIGHKEPFFVLNGDILSNIDYAELIKNHKTSKGATATIALYQVEDPSRYGVVELTRDNRVTRFVEKPTKEKAPSNLINAGIYMFEPEIFDYIPNGKKVSIEREVFPKLAREGKLYSYKFEGLWTDIGKPEDYLKANRLWLGVEIKNNQIEKNVRMETRVKIRVPSTINKGTIIHEGSEIGPHVALGEHVIIGKRVHVENAIIFPKSVISDSTIIRGAVVGEAAMIGNGVKIGNKCLIGDHAMIHDGVTLAQGVTVCPFKEVNESVLTPNKCLM